MRAQPTASEPSDTARSVIASLLIALLVSISTPVAFARASAPPEEPAGDDEDVGAQHEGRGDRAFARRAEGAPGDGTAVAKPIHESIEAYEAALAAAPTSLERRSKLLRALFFEGEYVPADKATRKNVFERGRVVFEEGLEQLAEQVGGRKDLDDLTPEQTARQFEHTPFAGELYFWGALHWGLWGEYYGNFAALRRGVAKKIRHYASVAQEIDERFDEAGPTRLLGRMHALAPRVPFVTGWVDHELGVQLLERAMELFPQDPLNRFFLAEAILEHERARSEQAIELLCSVRDDEPRAARMVEDTQAAQRALNRLRELGAESSCRAQGG